MRYLLISDLSGTLLEHHHISNESAGYYFCKEYESRINNIGRKLNQFLDQENRLVIISSVDHAEYAEIESVLFDIDSVISQDNKTKIEYYIQVSHQLNVVFDKIQRTFTKEHACAEALKKYQGYYPILMDDRLTSLESMVLNCGGQCVHINNRLDGVLASPELRLRLEKKWHLKDDMDTLINYYERTSSLYRGIHCCESEFHFDRNIAYQQLLSGQLNINHLYQLLSLADLKDHYIGLGYSLEEIENLIDHHCIEEVASFEQAYQKIIMPKMTREDSKL